MSLGILALLVVVGVGGVVLAIHLSGGTVTATLGSSTTAIDRFAEDFPDADVTEAVLSADQTAAILALSGDEAGIVHAVGDRFLTRHLTGNTSFAVRAENEVSLSLQLNDISWRGARLTFASGADRDMALGILTLGGERTDG